MTKSFDGIITQIHKEDIDINGDYIGPTQNEIEREKLNGDKSLRLTPPPSTPRRGSGKQQRWGRFMQTLCCCIAPPPPPSGVARDLNGRDGLYPEGKQISRSAPGTGSGSPISQIKNGGGSMSAGTTILTSSNASQQNGNSFSNAATVNNSPVNGRANATSSPPSPSAGNPLASIIAQTDRNGVQNGAEKNGNGAAGNNTVSTYETSEGGLQITVNGGGTNGIYKQAEKLLLPPLRASDANRKCLIIDLDETLVHSSFKPVKNPDFVIPVEIDGVVHQVYVLKRPYVDEFLARVGEKFECVLFTASLAKYADPVADLLDKRGVFRARLFREACVFHKGNYIKDLARLGRDLSRTIIVDNSPTSYLFHPENAIPVQTWFDDPSDVELLDILPLLDRLAAADSVYSLLRPRGDSSSPSDGAALLDRSYS